MYAEGTSSDWRHAWRRSFEVHCSPHSSLSSCSSPQNAVRKKVRCTLEIFANIDLTAGIVLMCLSSGRWDCLSRCAVQLAASKMFWKYVSSDIRWSRSRMGRGSSSDGEETFAGSSFDRFLTQRSPAGRSTAAAALASCGGVSFT